MLEQRFIQYYFVLSISILANVVEYYPGSVPTCDVDHVVIANYDHLLRSTLTACLFRSLATGFERST